MFNFDLWPMVQKVLEVVLGILLPVLVGFLAVYVRQLAQKASAWLAIKLGAEDLAMAREIVTIAVQAAEQSGFVAKAKQIVFDKKEYALKFASDYLESYGIFLDEAKLEALVESAVLDEFNRWKIPEGQVVAQAAGG